MVHERGDVAQAVVDHVRLRRELRMRAMPDELGNRKAALADIRIKSAIRKRAFRWDQMHARLALESIAQMPQLRDLGLAGFEGAFCLEINPAGILLMQLIELGTDVAPDARFFRRVIDKWRSQSLQPVPTA